jgi:hypothetical protein
MLDLLTERSELLPGWQLLLLVFIFNPGGEQSVWCLF